MLDGARLFIEPLPDEAELPRLLVTDAERAEAAAFGCQRRRCEYLMWRHIVRRELGVDTVIAYDGDGRPVLKNRNEHIGVSHGAGRVAVVISPRRCAVDIESTDRNFARAARRYATAAEQSLSADARCLCAIWCAKETLYKYCGCRGTDLLRDIRITAVDFAGGTVRGCVGDRPEVTMTLTVEEGALVVRIG